MVNKSSGLVIERDFFFILMVPEIFFIFIFLQFDNKAVAVVFAQLDGFCSVGTTKNNKCY